jgi:hypothetical protein
MPLGPKAFARKNDRNEKEEPKQGVFLHLAQDAIHLCNLLVSRPQEADR